MGMKPESTLVVYLTSNDVNDGGGNSGLLKKINQIILLSLLKTVAILAPKWLIVFFFHF